MDAFLVFEEKRLPYLDREKLKAKFLTFTEKNHPDKFRRSDNYPEVEKEFSQKREAYRILSDPKLRLAHLLELEFDFKPDTVKSMTKEVMELTWKLGEICQAVDQLKTKEPSNALAKAIFNNEKMSLLPKMRDLKFEVEERMENLEEQSKLINEMWKKGVRDKDSLIELYHFTAFLSKWSQQLDERLVWLLY